MFHYFKSKEEDQKTSQKNSQQKSSQNIVTNLIGKQFTNSKIQQTISNSLKLPSNIFAQLINQSLPSEKEVTKSPQKSEQTQENDMKDGLIEQNEIEVKYEKVLKPKSEVKKINKQECDEKQDLESESQNIQEKVQQNFVLQNKSQVFVSSKGANLSNLSQQDLKQLFQMFTDIFTHTIQFQLIGQKLAQRQNLRQILLPNTLETIQKINSSFYETFILETKQKYNHLADQSTNLFLKSRQIANFVNQFVMSINLFFESQELSIPAQQIQKAIADLNPQKTQKYINYLIKIFESNFDDVIEKRVNNMKISLENQIRKSQKQIKQLQQELKKVNSVLKQKQSTFSDQENKFSQKEFTITSLKREIAELTTKFNNVSSSSKQTQEDYNSELSLLKRQLQRSKKQFQELSDKHKKALKVIEKKQNLLKQKEQEIQTLGSVIKKVKQVESEGIQNIVEEMEMKEKKFADKIQKFSTQKIHLQQKIRTLTTDNESMTGKYNDLAKENALLKEEMTKLKEELMRLKEAENSQKNGGQNIEEDEEKKESVQQGENTETMSHKKKKLKSPKIQDSSDTEETPDISNLINKEIFRHLFLSFDDESKEWAIRNNVRNQIYIMLDIKKGSNSQDNPQKIGNPGINSPNKSQQNKKQNEGSLIGKWLGW